MRIEGLHTCNNQFDIKCFHEYEWMAVIPNRMSDPIYDVEKIDKIQGKIIRTEDESYTVVTICEKCNQDNVIEYKR